MEKLLFSLVVSVRKLRPYYQAHRIIVITEFPLRSILHNPDASQRLMKWAIELNQYDLLYRLKTAALLAGLRLAKELSIKRLAIYSDSQLITNQASGEYMPKHPRINHADALASLGSAQDTQFRRFIPVEHLDRPSIEEIEPIDSMQIDEDPSWQDPIIDYLVNGNLPTDKFEARKKALNIGYFWPTMRHDSAEYVKKCDRCQRY
ncbi:unnamed protein product, partial [Prunus brigantina]